MLMIKIKKHPGPMPVLKIREHPRTGVTEYLTLREFGGLEWWWSGPRVEAVWDSSTHELVHPPRWTDDRAREIVARQPLGSVPPAGRLLYRMIKEGPALCL